MGPRKPPKHLPKKFPKGHELEDTLTPSQWVGFLLQSKFEDNHSQKIEQIIAKRSANYDSYMANNDTNIRRSMSKFCVDYLHSPEGRRSARDAEVRWLRDRGSQWPVAGRSSCRRCDWDNGLRRLAS